jgi:hypothetical protein
MRAASMRSGMRPSVPPFGKCVIGDWRLVSCPRLTL